MWSRFRQAFVPYARRSRKHGQSKWTLSRKVKLFMDSFVAFSFFPIRLVSYLGMVVSLLGFAYAAFVILKAGARVIGEESDREGVYHLFVIRVNNRDSVKQKLQDAGIGTGIHYPIPLHMQVACAGLGYKKGDFPVRERLADEILSLPDDPEMMHEQQNYVIETLKAVLR